MKRSVVLVVAFAAVLTLIAWERRAFAADQKGLYADDIKDKTTGDLDDQDYWWTKWDAKMLEEAIKTRQPEGKIGMNVEVALRRINELEKKYPKHEQIKQWKTHFEEIDKKIDPNASRSASWKPGFPWDMSNFAQAWVNFQWGKMAADSGDVQRAVGLYQNVVYNLNLIAERPEMFDTMPEEYKKWAAEKRPEAQKILDDLKKKNH